jgi:hypothetical protein
MKKVLLPFALVLASVAPAGAEEAPAAPAAPPAPPVAEPAPAAPPTGAAPAPPPVDAMPTRRECFANLERYTWKRGSEPPVGAGLAFMTGLTACDDLLAASVERSVDFKVHDREAKVFANQKKFVIAAYAVLWVVLIGFVLIVWLRQRRLVDKIGDLEAKLRAAEGRQKSA